MKIPESFNQAYSRYLPDLERLSEWVRPRATAIAERHHGAYICRIKQPESILIKAEKEGVKHPFTELNDLFACTITVPDAKSVSLVRAEVEQEFELVTAHSRSVKPEEFAYSDLHLILQVKRSPQNEEEDYIWIPFELQVKTLLQQAWSQAGHDVIYKARRKTWALTRISSQLRALLEMADSVLANLETAANTLQQDIEYPQYADRNAIVEFLENTWPEDRLPANCYRAAQVIEKYLSFACLSAADLPTLVSKPDYSKYLGARTLTPTETVFIILFLERWGEMAGRLRTYNVLVTAEMMDLCPDLARIEHAHRVQLNPDP